MDGYPLLYSFIFSFFSSDPPDIEPIIKILGDQMPLVAGDNIHISCSIFGGNPIANLSWDCPGNVSTQTDNDKSISYLAFEMRTEDNRKTCSCIAVHTINNFTKSAHYILEVLCEYNKYIKCL